MFRLNQNASLSDFQPILDSQLTEQDLNEIRELARFLRQDSLDLEAEPASKKARTVTVLNRIEPDVQAVAEKIFVLPNPDSFRILGSEFPYYFRLLAHVLCDRDIQSSDLEGSSLKDLIPIFLNCINYISPDGFQKEALVKNLNFMLAVEADLTAQRTILRIDYLEELLNYLQTTLQDKIDSFDMNDRVAAERTIDLLTNFDVSGAFISYFPAAVSSFTWILSGKEILDTLKRSIEKTYNSQSVDSSPFLSNKALTSVMNTVEQLFVDFIYELEKEASLPAINRIVAAIESLEIGQELWVPGGYFKMPTSHSMIYKFIRSSEDSWNFAVINTGAGIENHDKIFEGSKYYFNPVLEFENIPSEHLLGRNEFGVPLFIEKIFSYKSPRHYIYHLIQKTKPADEALYGLFDLYLNPYRRLPSPKSSEARFISPQKSGTCTYRSIKAAMYTFFEDYDSYKKWLFRFKHFLLQNTFQCLQTLHLSRETKSDKQKVFQLASTNLITSIRKNLKRGAQNIDDLKEILDSAIFVQMIATSDVAQSQLLESQSIELVYGLLSSRNKMTLSLSPHYFMPLDTILEVHSRIESETQDEISCGMITFPLVSLGFENLQSDLAKIQKLLSENLDSNNLLFCFEYFRNLPFPSEEELSSLNLFEVGELLIAISRLVSKRTQHKNLDVLDFLFNLKVFILGCKMARLIHPGLLEKYPIYDITASYEDDHINYLKLPNSKLAAEFESCSQELKRLNQTAKAHDCPLFDDFLELELKLNSDCTDSLQSHAELTLYDEMVKTNADLEISLRGLADKDKYSKFDLLGFLLKDFDLESGPLAEHGYYGFLLIKNLYFSLARGLTTRSYTTSATNYEVCKKQNLLTFSFEDQFGNDASEFDKCIFFDAEYDELDRDAISRMSDAILYKKLDCSSEESFLHWGILESGDQEAFLLKNAKTILADFIDSSTLENDEQVTLFIEILIANINKTTKFKKLFELLSCKSRLDTINHPLLTEVFLLSFLRISKNNPDGQDFFRQIATDESLKDLVEDFADRFLDYVLNTKNSSNYYRIFCFLLDIKNRLSPAPFLTDLPKRLKSARCLKYHSNNYYLNVFQLRAHLFTDQERISKEYFLDLFRFYFAERSTYLDVSLTYELKKLLESNSHLFLDLEFVAKVAEIIAEQLMPHLAGKTKNYRFNLDDLTFWFDCEEENYGCKILTKEVIQKVGNTISYPLKYVGDFDLNSRFLCSLVDQLKELLFLRILPDRKIVRGKFGELSKSKSMDPNICHLNPTFLNLSTSFDSHLPDSLKGCTWILLNNYIEDQHALATGPSGFHPGNDMTEIAIREKTPQIFKQLPYELYPIAQLAYTKKEEKLFILALDKHSNPLLVLSSHGTQVDDITVLKDRSKIHIMSQDHPLAFLHGGKKLSLEISNDGKVLLKIAHHPGSKALALVDDGSNIYMQDDPDWFLDFENPPAVFNSTHFLQFVNQSNTAEKKILVPWLSLRSKKFQEDFKLKPSLVKHLLEYRFDGSNIIATNVETCIYLAFLKVLNQSQDVYHHIHETFKILLLNEQVPHQSQELFLDLLRSCCHFFPRSKHLKDSLSFFVLHLVSFVAKLAEDSERHRCYSQLSYLAKPVFSHYHQARIPEFAKFPNSFFVNGIMQLLSQNLPWFNIKLQNEIQMRSSDKEPEILFPRIDSSINFDAQNISFNASKNFFWQFNNFGIALVEEGIDSSYFDSYDFPQLVQGIQTDENFRKNLFFLLIEKITSRSQCTLSSISLAYHIKKMEHVLLAIALSPELGNHVKFTKVDSPELVVSFKIDQQHLPYFVEVLGQLNPKNPVSDIKLAGKRGKYLNERLDSKTYSFGLFREHRFSTKMNEGPKVHFSKEILRKSLELTHFYSRIREVLELSLKFNTRILRKPKAEVLSHPYGTRNRKRKTLDSLPITPHAKVSLQDYTLTIVEPAASTHLETLIRSLNSLFETEKNSLLRTFVFLEDHFLSDPSIKMHLQAHQHSSYTPKGITLDFLVDFFLDEAVEPYEHIFGLTDIPSMSREQKINLFSSLQENLAFVLFIKVECNRLRKFSQDIKSSQSAAQLNSVLREILDCDRSYLTQNLSYLLFEYKTGLNIRKNQLAIVESFQKLKDHSFSDQVAQLVMGGGKTSVVVPLIAQLSAKEDEITILITPKSQKMSLMRNLKRSQFSIFKQKVIDLDLTRAEMTTDKLKEIHDILEECKNTNSALVISTPEVVSGLELEYLSTLEQHDEDSLKLKILNSILCHIRAYSNCIVDEFAHIADVNKETNYPVRSNELNYEKVDPSFIDLFYQIFSFILTPALLDVIKIPSNEQMYLDQESWNRMIPSIVKHISSGILAKLLSDGLNFDLDQVENLLCERKLSGTLASKVDEKDQSISFKTLCLAHYTLHHLFPSALKKCGGRNYGRSTNESCPGKVIPYLGVGCPSSTEFGFPYETLCFHFLMAIQFDTSEQILKMVAQVLKDRALPKARVCNISIDNTEEGVIFHTITGLNLSGENLDFSIAKQKLDTERKENHFDNLLRLEKIIAEKYVGFHRFYFSSNPHDLFLQFKTVRGLTGTPWNHLSYNHQFQGNLLFDDSVEKQVEATFVSKPQIQGIKNSFFTTSTASPFELLDLVAKSLDPSDVLRLKAVIDSGGLFKEFTNEAVALNILEFLKSHTQMDLLCVVYFDFKKDDSSHPDQPAALIWDDSRRELKKVYLDSVSSIKETLKLSKDQYFVYFDERHTIGTDIPMSSSALSLITIDDKTPFHQFSQGIMRMRDYFNGQDAIVVVPHLLNETKPEHFVDRQAFINFLNVNQKNQLQSILLKSYSQQIRSYFRRTALDILLYDESDRAEEIYAALRGFLLSSEDYDPRFLAFSSNFSRGYKSLVDNSISLQDLFISTCDKIDPDLLKDSTLTALNQSILSILEHAFSNMELLYPERCSPESKVIVVEQEVTLDQELEQNLDSDLDANIKHFLSAPDDGKFKKLCPLDFKSVISHFSSYATSYNEGDHQIGRLADLNLNLGKPFEYPYYEGFETVYFSSALFDVYACRSESIFSFFKKSVGGMLLIINGITDEGFTSFRAIALTNFDLAKACTSLTDDLDHVFLVNTEGNLVKEHKYSHRLHQQNIQALIKKAILEICVVNGNYKTLSNYPVEAHDWLNDSKVINNHRSSEVKTLGDLRARIIKILISIKQDETFLPVLKLLIEGLLAKGVKDEIEFTKSKVEKACLALSNGQTKEVQSIISSIPKKMLDLIPTQLVPYVEKGNVHHLRTKERICALTEENVQLLKKSHLPFFNPDLILKMITVDNRIDLVPAATPLLRTIADDFSLPSLSKFSTSSFNFPVVAGKIGFPNLGNTCFANATLKAMMSSSNFERWISSPLIKKEGFTYVDPDTGARSYRGEETEAHFNLRLNLQRVLRELHQIYTTRAAEAPERITQLLLDLISNRLFLDKGLIRGFQHDAHEFFSVISEALAIDTVLESSLMVQNHSSSMIPLTSLRQSPAISIQELIDDCQRVDFLSFSCHLPGVLSSIGMQLPRFLDNHEKNNQLFTRVFSDCLLRTQTAGQVLNLRLRPRSIVCHEGNRRAGHYTSIDIENDFCLLHNDARVTKITREQAESHASRNGYLVFYDVEEVE